MNGVIVPLNTFSAFINWLYCKAQVNDFPGKYRFYLWSVKKFSGRVIRYSVNDRAFYVPLEEWCFWLEKGPTHYYPQDIQPFIDAIEECPQPVVFIDCGADIGVVSMMVAKGTNNVSRYICLEPNPNSFNLLSANQAAINNHSDLVNKAVSNFCGKALLHLDAKLTSDHEAYIQTDKEGSTEVTTLDQLADELGYFGAKHLALKIDVEGQESAVFEGAKNLLQHADSCLVLLELHPEVLQRIGQSPEDVFKAAESLVDFAWFVPELGNHVIDRSKDFFSQFPIKQYDVLGRFVRNKV